MSEYRGEGLSGIIRSIDSLENELRDLRRLEQEEEAAVQHYRQMLEAEEKEIQECRQKNESIRVEISQMEEREKYLIDAIENIQRSNSILIELEYQSSNNLQEERARNDQFQDNLKRKREADQSKISEILEMRRTVPALQRLDQAFSALFKITGKKETQQTESTLVEKDKCGGSWKEFKMKCVSMAEKYLEMTHLSQELARVQDQHNQGAWNNEREFEDFSDTSGLQPAMDVDHEERMGLENSNPNLLLPEDNFQEKEEEGSANMITDNSDGLAHQRLDKEVDQFYNSSTSDQCHESGTQPSESNRTPAEQGDRIDNSCERNQTRSDGTESMLEQTYTHQQTPKESLLASVEADNELSWTDSVIDKKQLTINRNQDDFKTPGIKSKRSNPNILDYVGDLDFSNRIDIGFEHGTQVGTGTSSAEDRGPVFEGPVNWSEAGKSFFGSKSSSTVVAKVDDETRHLNLSRFEAIEPPTPNTNRRNIKGGLLSLTQLSRESAPASPASPQGVVLESAPASPTSPPGFRRESIPASTASPPRVRRESAPASPTSMPGVRLESVQASPASLQGVLRESAPVSKSFPQEVESSMQEHSEPGEDTEDDSGAEHPYENSEMGEDQTELQEEVIINNTLIESAIMNADEESISRSHLRDVTTCLPGKNFKAFGTVDSSGWTDEKSCGRMSGVHPGGETKQPGSYSETDIGKPTARGEGMIGDGFGTSGTPGKETNANSGFATSLNPRFGTSTTPRKGTRGTTGFEKSLTSGSRKRLTSGSGKSVTSGSGTSATPVFGTRVTTGFGTNATPGFGTNVTPELGNGIAKDLGTGSTKVETGSTKELVTGSTNEYETGITRDLGREFPTELGTKNTNELGIENTKESETGSHLRIVNKITSSVEFGSGSETKKVSAASVKTLNTETYTTTGIKVKNTSRAGFESTASFGTELSGEGEETGYKSAKRSKVESTLGSATENKTGFGTKSFFGLGWEKSLKGSNSEVTTVNNTLRGTVSPSVIQNRTFNSAEIGIVSCATSRSREFVTVSSAVFGTASSTGFINASSTGFETASSTGFGTVRNKGFETASSKVDGTVSSAGFGTACSKVFGTVSSAGFGTASSTRFGNVSSAGFGTILAEPPTKSSVFEGSVKRVGFGTPSKEDFRTASKEDFGTVSKEGFENTGSPKLGSVSSARFETGNSARLENEDFSLFKFGNNSRCENDGFTGFGFANTSGNSDSTAFGDIGFQGFGTGCSTIFGRGSPNRNGIDRSIGFGNGSAARSGSKALFGIESKSGLECGRRLKVGSDKDESETKEEFARFFASVSQDDSSDSVPFKFQFGGDEEDEEEGQAGGGFSFF